MNRHTKHCRWHERLQLWIYEALFWVLSPAVVLWVLLEAGGEEE